MKTFEVEVVQYVQERATMVVEALNFEQARQKAQQMLDDDDPDLDWEDGDDTMGPSITAIRSK